jgi:hypothetical protein
VNISKYLDLIAKLNNAFPNSTITRWVSQDDHEDIVYVDEEGSRIEIKYFPVKKDEQKG